MHRSKLRNILKEIHKEYKDGYNKQINFCVSPLSKTKKLLCKLDTGIIREFFVKT